jgi:sigma-B regulation protein RsbU (phosphoserine phosphatase)
MLRSLLAIGEDLHVAPDLDSGLRRVADRLSEVVPYDTLGILLLDELGRELRFALAVGYPAEVPEHWRFGFGQGLVGTVARTGRPILVDDVRADRRYIDAGEGIVSELAVPLATRGRTVGVLVVGSRRSGTLTAEHQALLEALGGQLAASVEAARLYQSTREQARMLSLLHEVSRELTSLLDRRRILERVAELVERLIRYDVFTVYLWHPERMILEPKLARFRDGLPVGDVRTIELGQGLCGAAAALRKAIRVANVELDPRYAPCSHGLPVRSELVLPLIFEDQLLGVVDLESTDYDAFGSRDEELMSILCASMAIALENARLYEQVRASERTLEEDMASAREIQKRLLPHATALIPGLQVGAANEAARHLGGDFYDILPFGAGRLAVAVGDVAGKGSPAALYGALAVGMLREYALHNHCCDPSLVLSELNEKLHHLALGSRFLAMTFGVYDPADGALTLSGAGLPHPYLIHGGRGAAGGPVRVEAIGVEGVPLGLLPDREYTETKVSLEPGAAVVITSDGIEESLRAGEEFGKERIRRVLARLADASANEIAEGLLADARRFAGLDDAADDRTVLVVKRL